MPGVTYRPELVRGYSTSEIIDWAKKRAATQIVPAPRAAMEKRDRDRDRQPLEVTCRQIAECLRARGNARLTDLIEMTGLHSSSVRYAIRSLLASGDIEETPPAEAISLPQGRHYRVRKGGAK